MSVALSMAQRDGIVYVIHNPTNRNVTSALEYGYKMVEVLEADIEPNPANSQRITRDITQSLATFTSDDWLLLGGSPIAIAIACAVAAIKTKGRLKLLKWDRQEGRYFPAEVIINQR